MGKRPWHALTAGLLVAAAALFIFSESVEAALLGLGLVIAAAICLVLAIRRA